MFSIYIFNPSKTESENQWRAGRTAQLGKMLASMAHDLDLIPRSHTVSSHGDALCKLSSDLHRNMVVHAYTCTHSECNENPVVTRISIIKYSSTLKPQSRNICYFIHRRMRHCNTSQARPEALITHFKAGCANRV